MMAVLPRARASIKERGAGGWRVATDLGNAGGGHLAVTPGFRLASLY
jgi:hypothetical protein